MLEAAEDMKDHPGIPATSINWGEENEVVEEISWEVEKVYRRDGES